MTPEWHKKNDRRLDLAEKKSVGELTTDEAQELERLQAECFSELDAAMPRSDVQDRLTEIERRLAEKGPTNAES